MDLFQEYFVTAMVALIFSCIIVKLVSAAVSNDGKKIDHKEKVVVEEAKITKGLVVRSRKSKKRVKFVDQEVVGNVNHNEGMPCKVGGVVDQSENAGENKVALEEKVFVEKKIEGIIKKGDDFKGEKVLENLDLIEHCGGEREVIDGHDDADMCSKIMLLEEKDEVNKIDKKNEDILNKGDDLKEEKLLEYLNLIEQCDGHEDKDMSSKIGLLEENDEVKKIDELVVGKEKDIVNISVVDEVKLGENEVVEVGEGLSKKTDKKVTDEDSDDDWEGIDRSELEEEFVKAVNFVDGEKLRSELMMQLYGLQKIAMEGPCHEPQPMALKVYARAKWNAWQKMGSLKSEVAMEQYIKLLSDHVPQWTHHTKDDCGVASSETKMPGEPDYIPNSINDISKDERTREMNHAAEGGDFSGGEKDKE
ncbi:hypothetical protein K7X08_001993 [Anisodus acutangulus]|uniref:ACB domain-containing protein n=1 Tax=Anisodus acutangulus TaxID=402998 RepID=A0A9Q1R5U3_9SOLA|nr:hypothetical protein K7X08_001993 [Anisodus acutangulus]